MQADVIVVGGSFAGLSAALQLARARRQIVVVDSGLRRNRFASTSHGFLGQDGRPPADIVADARRQLMAYPTVRWIDAEATHAEKTSEGFVVIAGEQALRAKRLILATGVVDELPAIEGVRERWGQHVFHCPYCHGFELNQGRIGVLATSELSLHQALLLPDWGTVTFFVNGAFSPDDAHLQALASRGVQVEAERIIRVTDQATVELLSGRRIVLDGLFTMGQTRMASALPQQLGCAFDDGPTGSYLRVNATMETSVPSVFACGDAARAFGNVALAVGDGAMAGAGTHRSIVFPC